MDLQVIGIVVIIVLVMVLYTRSNCCKCCSTEKMSVLDQRSYDLDRDSLGYTKTDYALMALNRAYNYTPIA